VIITTKASQHLIPAVARSGATRPLVDGAWIWQKIERTFGPKIALQGNVDPAVLLALQKNSRYDAGNP